MVKIVQLDSSKKNKFISGLSLTVKLIILNVILYFIATLAIGVYGEKIFHLFALTPSMILAGQSIWAFLTSMFMHGSFFHLFANMFTLFFIGSFLEKIIGQKRFLLVYLLAGLVGGVFYVVATMIFGDINIPAVGASGAIFGLLGVLAVLVPKSKIYLIAGPLILILIDVLARVILPSNLISVVSTIIGILIWVMIFSILSFNPRWRKFAVPIKLPMWVLPIIAIVPLSIIGLFVNLPIGNSAHLGGLVVGLIFGFYLRQKFPKKTARLSRMFK